MCQKTPNLEECEFKWGKKRGIGGKHKEVQFYGSFTYDGDEYFLYDDVYLHKEGEPEPYIGKLVKIWEQPGQKKKVKVLWYFRPVEIHNFLEGGTTPENELFLACGDGSGLTNINPLESVAGKCHVVCTSKDNRNPQPCVEEVKKARYVYYRTFNVENGAISDKIDDKIAGVEVKFLFNKERGENDKNVKPTMVGCSTKLSSNVTPALEANSDKVKEKMKKNGTSIIRKKRKANADDKSKANPSPKVVKTVIVI